MAISFIFIMDIIGTIAFAASGAMTAIHKEMDLFGVTILAVTTAVGGGVLRDILIGHIPPEMFRNPIYVIVALITAILTFAWAYVRNSEAFKDRKIVTIGIHPLYEKILFWFDTLGLAAFSVDGVNNGIHSEYGNNFFLIVVLGVITGVGGGVLRDVLANQTPYIFVKHIYACASILGALTTALLGELVGENRAILIGFFVTILLRIYAAHYRLNLPRIRKYQ